MSDYLKKRHYLRKLIKNILFVLKNCFPIGKKVFLLCTPDHENIGDSAIVLAEYAILSDCGYKKSRIKEFTSTEYSQNSGMLNRYISSRNLICLHGGGNMGNVWYGEELLRQHVLKSNTQNKIVVFPQTFFYTDDLIGKEYLEKSKYVYNKTNLTITAREKESYKLMNETYRDARVIISPDAVLYTDYSSYDINPHTHNRKGVLLVFRNDIEQSINGEVVTCIENYLYENNYQYRFSDMYSKQTITKEHRCLEVSTKLNEFSTQELIITDRLHGMLFACITGTPCIVFSNNNHKVTGTYEWIKHLNYIKYVETADEAIEYIPQLMKMKDCKYDKTVLMPYFEDLIDVIKE